jgi:hypothetical protein
MGKSVAHLACRWHNHLSQLPWRGRTSLMGMSSTTTQCIFCAAILWLGAVVGAQGSIVVPECQLFTVDLNLEAGAAGAGSSTDSSSPAPSSDEKRNRRGYDRTTEQDAFSFGGSSTGTSTSSSGSSGGSNTFAARTVDADLFTDPATGGWHSGERRFAIPMPPVNALLRPPQS